MIKKIAIIEDEVIIAENLRRILVKLGYDVIAVANSYREGEGVINSTQADLYLIDINLKEGNNNGIKLAKLINKISKTPIVYITSNADTNTVNQAKLTNPVGYIIKPFSKQTIFSTLEIAFHNRQNKIDGLSVRHKGNLVKVHFKDILFIKASSVYVDIYTSKESYLHRTTLKELIKVLPSNFIQVHRSYIVNLKCITSINSATASLEKAQIPIGRTYKTATLDTFSNIQIT